jgi:hypothetical protein
VNGVVIPDDVQDVLESLYSEIIPGDVKKLKIVVLKDEYKSIELFLYWQSGTKFGISTNQQPTVQNVNNVVLLKHSLQKNKPRSLYMTTACLENVHSVEVTRSNNSETLPVYHVEFESICLFHQEVFSVLNSDNNVVVTKVNYCMARWVG